MLQATLLSTTQPTSKQIKFPPMAFSLQEMEARLPPEFFNDLPSTHSCFPFHNDDCFDEDDYAFLLGLGPRPTRPAPKQALAVSPVSTLYGANDLWSCSTNGSPRGAFSPTEIKSNARDVILAAADQVARLKLGYPPSMAPNHYPHYITKQSPAHRPFCGPVRRNDDPARPFFLPLSHGHVPHRNFRSFAPASFEKRERSGTGVFLPRQYGGVSAPSVPDLRKPGFSDGVVRDLKSARQIAPRSNCDGIQFELVGQPRKTMRSENSNEIRLPQEWSY